MQKLISVVILVFGVIFGGLKVCWRRLIAFLLAPVVRGVLVVAAFGPLTFLTSQMAHAGPLIEQKDQVEISDMEAAKRMLEQAEKARKKGERAARKAAQDRKLAEVAAAEAKSDKEEVKEVASKAAWDRKAAEKAASESAENRAAAEQAAALTGIHQTELTRTLALQTAKIDRALEMQEAFNRLLRILTWVAAAIVPILILGFTLFLTLWLRTGRQDKEVQRQSHRFVLEKVEELATLVVAQNLEQTRAADVRAKKEVSAWEPIKSLLEHLAEVLVVIERSMVAEKGLGVFELDDFWKVPVNQAAPVATQVPMGSPSAPSGGVISEFTRVGELVYKLFTGEGAESNPEEVAQELNAHRQSGEPLLAVVRHGRLYLKPSSEHSTDPSTELVGQTTEVLSRASKISAEDRAPHRTGFQEELPAHPFGRSSSSPRSEGGQASPPMMTQPA